MPGVDFLNATFGNVAELIIAVFLLLDDEVEIPMDFVFTPFEVAAALISRDGHSNRLEGAQLVGAYLIIAISFFFVGDA